MKKFLASLTAVALVSSTMLGAQAAPAKPSDISGHWAQETIQKWIDNAKISGYEDGTFKPNHGISRAEFASMLCRVLPEWSYSEEVAVPFKDISASDWYYKDIVILLQRNIVSESTAFNPKSPITRQDAMTMLARAYRPLPDETKSAEKLADYKDISAYAVEHISALLAEKAIKGYPDNTIKPLNPISRAESLTLIDGMAKLPAKGSLEFVIKEIYAGVPTKMPMVVNTTITSENSEYFLGIPNMKFEEAVASESMMGSQAHSVCLVRVAEGSDVAAIKEQIRTSVNPRKWICVGVEREDIIVENQGNLILLVMDQFAPKEIAASFMKTDVSVPAEKPDETSKIQLIDGQYVESIGELRPASVENFAKKVDSISTKYLSKSQNIYYAMVPSKNYYIADKLTPKFDYAKMDEILTNNIKKAEKITLTDCLSYQDYYKTDFHWKQESLQKVADKLGAKLGFKTDLSTYKANTVNDFVGQFGYGKKDFPTETLTYLSSAQIDKATVKNHEKPADTSVYNTKMLATFSPYDVFLSGASPLVEITNPENKTGKELVIFRDSFTSGLAPLMIESYSKITLIDIRYMMTAALPQFVDFHGQDVLFLYNDQIINNSEMLK